MKVLYPALAICLATTTACNAGVPSSTVAMPASGNATEVPADGADRVSPAASVTAGTDNAVAETAQPDASETAGQQSTADIIRNVTAVLRTNLRRPGVALDGHPVTDLRATSPCEATIVAGTAGATFKWAEIGNIAAELDGATQVLRLPADGADAHVLKMPRGQAGDNIVSNIEMLESSCQHDG